MRKIKLEAMNYNCIMEVTNDFVMAHVIPRHNTIKIKTYTQGDKWISEVEYEQKL